MLYDKHFGRLERIRWSLEDDIPWDTVRPELLTDYQKNLIRNICKTEIGALFAAEAFLRDFYDDIDFSCAISVWYYEEMKHFLVLKRYLSVLGIHIDKPELQDLRMTIPESSRETILMVHFTSEHRLAAWYMGISHWLEEPLGKNIFKRIAQDELRHGQIYFDFIMRDLVQAPARLLPYLRAAMFMLSPKAPPDIHAVTLTGTTQRLDDPHYIRFLDTTVVTPEHKASTFRRIYANLSLLAKETISDYSSLSALVKRLKLAQRSTLVPV